jgi:hypothetical protein
MARGMAITSFQVDIGVIIDVLRGDSVDEIAAIFKDFIREEFLTPKAILVTFLSALVLTKWFRRRFPVLAPIIVAIIIIISFPSLWKWAVGFAIILAINGLLRN